MYDRRSFLLGSVSVAATSAHAAEEPVTAAFIGTGEVVGATGIDEQGQRPGNGPDR